MEQCEIAISKGIDIVLFPEYVTLDLLAMAGPDLPFTGFGKSCILCPVDDRTMVSNGILVEANVADGELVLVGEIDLDILHQSRESSEATILKDRRPETYKEHYTLL